MPPIESTQYFRFMSWTNRLVAIEVNTEQLAPQFPYSHANHIQSATHANIGPTQACTWRVAHHRCGWIKHELAIHEFDSISIADCLGGQDGSMHTWWVCDDRTITDEIREYVTEAAISRSLSGPLDPRWHTNCNNNKSSCSLDFASLESGKLVQDSAFGKSLHKSLQIEALTTRSLCQNLARDDI